MENTKKIIAIGFGVLAILGIWGIIDEDISLKAIGSLGIILIVTFISSVFLNNISKNK